MDILRFMTAGNVDDGKSTLIGRLLYDSKSIMADHLATLEKQSKVKEHGGIDLALLTDGLRAEREQGITIDVAYKYFATPRRKFIIADTPGHVQYTRNMVTGASHADLAIILIDARHGVAEQTTRHSLIVSLLGIPHVVVAVNKMDLVDYSREVFEKICEDYRLLASEAGLRDVHYIPISAAKGDNVVEPGRLMNWYNGPPLLTYLEDLEVEKDLNLEHPRFTVQYVIRPQTRELHDYRGYAGTVHSGVYRTGQQVVVLPAGLHTRIARMERNGHETAEAGPLQSIVMHLADDVDVSRGDMIVPAGQLPVLSQEMEATLCWMDQKPLLAGQRYILQLNSTRVRASVREISYRLDVQSRQKIDLPAQAVLNDIVHVKLKTAQPLAFDHYHQLPATGGAILIDETSHHTAAACMLEPVV